MGITITLEPNSDGKCVYYSGHVLKGVVELSTKNVKKYRGLHVTIAGRAQCHWTKTESRYHHNNDFLGMLFSSGSRHRSGRHRVTYRGEQVYLNSRTYLFGYRDGPSIEIQPGIHKYNFACLMPPNIPCSLSARYGNVAYFVKVVLDIPWGPDKENTIGFCVANNHDLNLYPELCIPQKFKEVKSYNCFCFGTESLTMIVSLPCIGFARGQQIPIHIEYVNDSDVKFSKTIMTLMRSITYVSSDPRPNTKSQTEAMIKAEGPGVEKHKSHTFEALFEIPSFMSNTTRNPFDIIRVSYYLTITANARGWHGNSTINIPITIGSIPIQFSNPPIEYIPQNFITQPQQFDVMPPQYGEAMEFRQPLNSEFMMEPNTSNIGWGASAPSAPESEPLTEKPKYMDN